MADKQSSDSQQKASKEAQANKTVSQQPEARTIHPAAENIDPDTGLGGEDCSCGPTDIIGGWNDQHGQTAAAVIAALRDAADDWDRIHRSVK